MEKNDFQESAIEIKPFGSYFEIDEEGYIVNPASLDKIQEEYKPVIESIVEAYKTHFGEHLKSVYLRGSVAKGQAVIGVSDVDSLAFIDLPKDAVDYDWEQSAEEKIERMYPFVEGTELSSRPLSSAFGPFNRILLNQSVCVYGEPLEISKVKPGRDVMLHIYNLDKRASLLDERLDNAKSEESLRAACVWLAKDILRTGFELTMERSGRYTRDLYLCYKDFSEYYPEKEQEMREVLQYALNPTSDRKKIEALRNSFAPWLREEAKKLGLTDVTTKNR